MITQINWFDPNYGIQIWIDNWPSNKMIYVIIALVLFYYHPKYEIEKDQSKEHRTRDLILSFCIPALKLGTRIA